MEEYEQLQTIYDDNQYKHSGGGEKEKKYPLYEKKPIIQKTYYRWGLFLISIEVVFILLAIIFGIVVAIDAPIGLIGVVVLIGFHSLLIIFISLILSGLSNPENPENHITTGEFLTRMITTAMFVIVDAFVLLDHILASELALEEEYETYHTLIIILSAVFTFNSLATFIWIFFSVSRLKKYQKRGKGEPMRKITQQQYKSDKNIGYIF